MVVHYIEKKKTFYVVIAYKLSIQKEHKTSYNNYLKINGKQRIIMPNANTNALNSGIMKEK